MAATPESALLGRLLRKKPEVVDDHVEQVGKRRRRFIVRSPPDRIIEPDPLDNCTEEVEEIGDVEVPFSASLDRLLNPTAALRGL